jgi:hypothetical protein
LKIKTTAIPYIAKLYRDYLFDNGASVYSALLCKYINPYLNRYYWELLKSLPVNNEFVIEAEMV